MARLVGCVCAYNEAEYLPYSVGSIYNEVDDIIFVEGAIENRFRTPHSTDGTLEVIRSLDVDKKITIVQKEGGGFWSSYEENKGQFSRFLNPGDWYVQCDADEVYNEGDLSKLRKIIAARPEYREFIPISIEFYGDLRHSMKPGDGVNPTQQRIVRHSSGDHWTCHHPVLCVKGHKDSVFDLEESKRRILIPDLIIYHLSWTKDMDFLYNKYVSYFMIFDKMSREDAEKKAAAKLEWAMSRVMYYDGPIPKILKGSRWDADLVENNSRSSAFKHWHTSIEYYKKDLMPKIHHYEWKGTKSVGVVIPCYNNLSTLKITLPQWKKMRYDNYTVTVVDDGSPADSGIKEYVESLGYKYCYNDTGNTYSISSARNLGIWNTDSSRILFVDSDIIPDSYLVSEHVYNSKNDVITAGIRHGIDRCVTFLQGCSIKDMNSVWKELSDSTWYENNPDEASKLLIEAMERYDFSNWWAAYGSKPMISVFSDRIVTSSWFGSSTLHIPIIVDKDRHEEFLRVHRGESEPNWTMVHGHNFSVDRRHLLEINGFDEDFDGQWGAEENDLVFRLIKKGLVVKPLITAIGYHINHRSRSVKGGDNNNNLFISKMSHDIVRRRPRSWEK